MARKTKRSALFLKDDELQELSRISRTRIAPAQEIQRAKILLSYYENPIISEVARKVGVVRDTIYKCIDKALEMGVERALKDLYHSLKEPTITMEAKAWLVNIACSKQKRFWDGGGAMDTKGTCRLCSQTCCESWTSIAKQGRKSHGKSDTEKTDIATP